MTLVRKYVVVGVGVDEHSTEPGKAEGRMAAGKRAY